MYISNSNSAPTANSSSNMNLCSNFNLNSTSLNTFNQDFTSHHSSAMVPNHLTSHHFASHYSHQPSSSLYTTSQSSFNSQPFDQNQFSTLSRHSNHGLHSSFNPSPFHMSLPKSNFEHSFGSLGSQSLMPNDSCNSSGSISSGSSSNSPNSSSSSSPDSKFNFIHTSQSNYLNYLNQNTAFPSPNSISNSLQHQLQSNNSTTIHHQSMQNQYSSFNSTSKPFVNQFNNKLVSYDEDDLRGEDESDEISMSHLDLKAMMHYNNSSRSEPLPGKIRTREKYRSVYSEQQRHELENEFQNNKYITIKRKTELAQALNLSERQVKIWFQNKRSSQRKLEKKRETKRMCENAFKHMSEIQRKDFERGEKICLE